jgi:putative transposase
MREPYHQLYVHLIWATWDRLPLLTPERRKIVYAAIQAECTRLKTELIALGGIEDHVHLLVRYAPSLSISELVKQVKGASSHLMTHDVDTDAFFKWQGGYMAYSISKSEAPRIRDYIQRQQEHHRNKTLWPDAEMASEESNPE